MTSSVSALMKASIFGISIIVVYSQCESEYPAYGGWRRSDDLENQWLKGGDPVSCSGLCRPVPENLNEGPFREEENAEPSQGIVKPVDEAWFDEENPLWCPTGALPYQQTGSEKKFWGYCTCPVPCEAIVEEEMCKTSLYTDSAVKCDFYNGKCMKLPTCSDANDVYGPELLEQKCESISGCFFLEGKCMDLPETCSEVNEIRMPGKEFIRVCQMAPERCFPAGGVCRAIPETCDEVNKYLNPGSKRLENVCAAVKRCFMGNGKCQALPENCDEVNNLGLFRFGRNFKAVCESVSGCLERRGRCFEVPKTCDEVNGMTQNKDIVKFICQRNEQGCYIYKNKCYAFAKNCSEVNNVHRRINRNGKKFVEICEGAPNCMVLESSCVKAPSSCSDVNDMFPTGEVNIQMCRGVRTEICDVIEGVCASAEGCSHFSNRKFACLQAYGCVYRNARCCASDNICLSYSASECRDHQDICDYKGPFFRRRCVCK